MRARPIHELRGLGPASARLLACVGIRDEAELRAVGAAEAFARVKLASDPQASLNLLYALQAALMDVDWRSLPAGLKRSLREQVRISSS